MGDVSDHLAIPKGASALVIPRSRFAAGEDHERALSALMFQAVE